jgi:hypothetical protein
VQCLTNTVAWFMTLCRKDCYAAIWAGREQSAEMNVQTKKALNLRIPCSEKPQQCLIPATCYCWGADKSLTRPGRKRLTGHLQPKGKWPTWASNVLITHPILRIWPRLTTTCSLDWKKQLKGKSVGLRTFQHPYRMTK